jgi:hypothetical protein
VDLSDIPEAGEEWFKGATLLDPLTPSIMDPPGTPLRERGFIDEATAQLREITGIDRDHWLDHGAGVLKGQPIPVDYAITICPHGKKHEICITCDSPESDGEMHMREMRIAAAVRTGKACSPGTPESGNTCNICGKGPCTGTYARNDVG